jgi:uncharacterized Zn finger protein (UPF0148 family)
MKVCEKCGEEIYTKDGDNRCQKCDEGKKKKAKRSRKAVDDVMRELGLVKVRGALGGVYYE